jgi:pterin-4a-carbinolamine dehydratase
VSRGRADAVFASIITPTRGRPAALERTLRSLQAQDSPDWEALVVDDGDGEGVELAASLGDPRIRATRATGTGQVDARNAGIVLAAGEMVCWLDDDDWWDDPHHLSLLRDAVATHPGSFYFRGGWIVRDADGSREAFDLAATPETLQRDNTILTSSLAYPRALHRRLGLLDRELGGYCDWDFMLRMCEAGVHPQKLPGLGIAYAIHASNVSTAYDAPQRRRGFERFKAKHALEIQIANHELIHRMGGTMSSAQPEGWEEVDGALERRFRFDTFPDAIAFVNRVAELAESENHHPDIAVSYRDVTLRWRTHSADAITDRDREMAVRSAAVV